MTKHIFFRNSQLLQDIKSLKIVFTPAYLLRAILFFIVFYLISLCVTHFSWWFLIDKMGITINHLDSRYWPKFIIVFVVFFWPFLYLFPCLMAKQFLSLNVSKLILYMGCTFFGAMLCEVLLDTLFVKFTGQPSWIYKIWPIHHGYTSGVGMFMWPLYGFLIYCMNRAIESNPKLIGMNNGIAKAYLYAIDAMVLEILTNIFAILLFHTYLFYYLPDDLMHFTTIQIFIPYLFLCGLGAALSWFLELLKKNFFMIGIAFYLAGVGCLFLLG